MVSRFCGSVLLLTLIAFEGQATANLYSHAGRRIAPHSEQGEGLPHRYKPASSSYSGYGLPKASLGSSRLAERGSPKSHSRLAAAGSQSGAYGRHVDGNSRQGSVSSYRPASPWSSKPRQTPQQPQRGTHKSKLAMWAHPSPQNGEAFGPRVVSSGAIEMLAGTKPPQKQPVVKAGVWGDALVSTGRSPDVKRANAPRRPVTSTDYYSRRQQPSSKATGGKWDTAFPQGEGKFRSVSALDRATVKPLKKQLSSPSSGVSLSQSRGGKWDSLSGSKIKSMNLNKQTGLLPRGPRPMTASSFGVEQPSSETTVLQSKEDMWKTANLPVRNDLRPASVSSRRVPALYSTPKPSLRESSSSASGKTDIKAAMWGGAYDSNPLNARPRSYPGPVASLYPHEGKRPQVVSVSGRSRWPSAH